MALADIVAEELGGAFFTLTEAKEPEEVLVWCESRERIFGANKAASSGQWVKIKSQETPLSPRFLITGSQSKFQAILLTPNRAHTVPLNQALF